MAATGKMAAFGAGMAEGMVAEATPPGRDPSELNDPGLEAKVESELLHVPGERAPDVS